MSSAFACFLPKTGTPINLAFWDTDCATKCAYRFSLHRCGRYRLFSSSSMRLVSREFSCILRIGASLCAGVAGCQLLSFWRYRGGIVSDRFSSSSSSSSSMRLVNIHGVLVYIVSLRTKGTYFYFFSSIFFLENGVVRTR